MSVVHAGETIEFEGIQGYLALPAAGSGPAVLVLSEAWGLVDQIRDVCDRFAREGFVALAPDLFQGRVAEDLDAAGRLMLGLEVPRAAEELKTAAKALLCRNEVDGARLGAVGFCMGGQLALFAATEDPQIGAVVDFYGVHPEIKPDFSKLEAKLLGLFAENDEFLDVAVVEKLKADLEDAGKSATCRIFPGVSHAFFNEARPDVYNAVAAAEAWADTIAFLRTELS